PFSRPSPYMGELVNSGRSTAVRIAEKMGGWESIEMVQRYAHLAPNHLVEHARRIDEAMGINGTNMARALIKAV
ncbi:site-specific integrase, partial [Morganella morganii]